MRPCKLIRLPVVLAAVFAAASVHAELYKWVDGRGVTNYSNQAPADPVAAKKVTTVEDRISVYTPDKALLQAVEAARQQRNNPAVTARIASLEQQLEDERRARQYAIAAAQTPPVPLYSGHTYFPTAVLLPVRPRHLSNFAPGQMTPGTIIGSPPGAPIGTLFPSPAHRSTGRGIGTR
jgi:hypothetical protein